MTCLLEKSLLTAFGIFTLILFLTFVIPFLGEISDYNENDRGDLESYMTFINEVDNAILQVIDNPEDPSLNSVQYPENLNITFDNYYVKFYYLLENKQQIKILEYEEPFFQSSYQNIPSQTYLMKVSYRGSSIEVSFT
ncbi:MAG: hypothetical protein ACTSRI_09210 [Promethearchaeota archaeon]